MKLWIAPDSIWVPSYEDVKSDRYKAPDYKRESRMVLAAKEAGEALNYELNVYKEIIRPLIDCQVSPNFIRYLGSGIGCIASSIGAFPGVNPTKILRNWTYMLGGISNRPSVTERKQGTHFKSYFGWQSIEQINAYFSNCRYNMLLNEAIPASAATFWSFLRKRSTTKDEILNVLFQILSACYAMSMCHMNHNDLHLGNIWVEPLPSEQTYTYVYGDRVYSLRTKYVAKLYDFDRAYVERMGGNPLLGATTLDGKLLDTDDLCQRASQCNVFTPTKDMAKLAVEYYSATKNSIVINALSDDEKVINTLKTAGRFLQESQTQRLPTDFYAQLEDPSSVLFRMAQQVPSTIMTITDIKDGYSVTDKVFVCQAERFENTGALIETCSVSQPASEEKKGGLRGATPPPTAPASEEKKGGLRGGTSPPPLERVYTRAELQRKTVKDLKQILRDDGCVGFHHLRKNDMITTILAGDCRKERLKPGRRRG